MLALHISSLWLPSTCQQNIIMQPQPKLAAGLFGIMMMLVSPASQANLMLEDRGVKSQYMEAQRDSEVYSLVNEHVIPVGVVKRGPLIQVFPAVAEYYEFKFGHGTGFIDKNDVHKLKRPRKVKVQDPLGELNKPLTNQNLITQKATNVYIVADSQSEVFGTLEENLRYPIIGKLKDRLNNTWYVVNVGDRLGYISKLDCEIDNGIPVLTYHHLLKNEENKRFRHTSTTTSDVAFSNPMTYLKQAGYDIAVSAGSLPKEPG